jgi:hypothetical protein
MTFALARQAKGPRHPKTGKAVLCLVGVGISYSRLFYQQPPVDLARHAGSSPPEILSLIADDHNPTFEDVLNRRGVTPVLAARKQRRQPQETYDPDIKVTTRLSTVWNTSAAIDLFGAMLRAVETTEQRIAEEGRNGKQTERH